MLQILVTDLIDYSQQFDFIPEETFQSIIGDFRRRSRLFRPLLQRQTLCTEKRD